ncbi:MAG: RsiG family protein [Acidimicrobiales bacterium]
MTDATGRLLDLGQLGDLSARPIEEIRELRAQCQRAEVRLSFLRRLIQGRLDIVASDLARRAEGGAAPDLAGLVKSLPGILADAARQPGSGPGRLPTYLAPGDMGELTAELDAIVDPRTLATLADQDKNHVRNLAERLSSREREVSDERRRLHDHIDVLQAELTRRYKTGQASVETLLQ